MTKLNASMWVGTAAQLATFLGPDTELQVWQDNDHWFVKIIRPQDQWEKSSEALNVALYEAFTELVKRQS